MKSNLGHWCLLFWENSLVYEKSILKVQLLVHISIQTTHRFLGWIIGLGSSLLIGWCRLLSFLEARLKFQNNILKNQISILFHIHKMNEYKCNFGLKMYQLRMKMKVKSNLGHWCLLYEKNWMFYSQHHQEFEKWQLKLEKIENIWEWPQPIN